MLGYTEQIEEKTKLKTFYNGTRFLLIDNVLVELKGILAIKLDHTIFINLLRWLGGLNEIFLFIEETNIDGIGSFIGRHELKEKISFVIISLNILKSHFSSTYSFLKISAINPNLHHEQTTVHFRY